MAEKACVKRLQKEYRSLCKEPVSHVTARPSPTDILEWHYVLEGSEGTPFSGGYYYGKIKFPPDYPYKPPGITMITPNGRFMTQKKICLSMSDFHPESWNPMWSVASILTGLLSFMMDNSPTTGSVSTTDIEKQRLAKTSLAFNCKNPTFRKIFPEYIEKHEKHQKLSNQPTNTNDGELLVAASPQLPHNPTLRARNQGEEQQQQQLQPREEEEEEAVNNNNNNNPRRRQQEEGRRKQSVPTWVLVLLFSVFGIVMALPLLQL